MPETPNVQRRHSKSSFGIVQLMIVVAICAVALACAFPATHIPGRPKPGANAANLLLGSSELVVGLFSLFGAAVVLSRWVRNRRLPEEPGELLFLFCAFAFMVANLADVLFASTLEKAQPGDRVQGINDATGLLYVRGITQVFLALVCAFGFPRNRWWWQVGFVGLMLSMLAQLAVTAISLSLVGEYNSVGAVRIARLVGAGLSGLVVLWLILCGVIDLAKKVKRSRLHWLGVLCFLVFSILPNITAVIASRYLSYTELYGLE